MRVESPQETFSRFTTQGWLQESPSVLAADFASSSNETHRNWDPFYYEVREGRLFDPVRKKYVEETDGGDPIQKSVNAQIEEWVLSSEEGIAVHFSPRGGRWKYPDDQIEIYRITYEYPSMDKKVFCSFHQFDGKLTNREDLRKYIFTEKDSEEAIFALISWVESKSTQKLELNIANVLARKEQAFFYAEQIANGINPNAVFAQMNESGFLGNNPIGCSTVDTTSVYGYSTSTSEMPVYQNYDISDGLGPKEFNCPACGFKNRRPNGGLVQRCQNSDCSKPDAVLCGV